MAMTSISFLRPVLLRPTLTALPLATFSTPIETAVSASILGKAGPTFSVNERTRLAKDMNHAVSICHHNATYYRLGRRWCLSSQMHHPSKKSPSTNPTGALTNLWVT
ncbi:hypothetical protein BD309DRAFT_541893 [Dichomitus squalens]|nr:hypothetical protein BD309DRAFT_541893 [Dichomitus squalens]